MAEKAILLGGGGERKNRLMARRLLVEAHFKFCAKSEKFGIRKELFFSADWAGDKDMP